MGNIKVGVVEDELIIAHDIVQTLLSLGYEATEPAISYTEALGMIVSEQPDILLLDIQLKGHKDGIELAQAIREQFNIPFIFLTANADAATIGRAKGLNPHAYLVKPFNKDELYAAIEICLHNFSANNSRSQPEEKSGYLVKDSMFIKQGQRYLKVKLSDITHIESSDVYINIYTAKNKFLLRSSIQHYLDQMGAAQFVRVHKSYAVNADHIDSIGADGISVNGVEIPIGRAYRDEVMAFLKVE